MTPKPKDFSLTILPAFLLAFSLFPTGLRAQEDTLLFLPSNPVFDRLIGDPREPQNYLAAELNKPRFDGSISATIEILQWVQKDKTRWGLGVEGDTFIQVESPGYGPLSLTDRTYFLVVPERVSDWYLGAFISESSRGFSNLLEVMHVSSQLRDGSFADIQNFVSTQVSFRYTASFRPSDQLRLYGGLGYFSQVLHGEPPVFAHAGAEIYSPYQGFIFSTWLRGYSTYDLQLNQDVGGVISQNFEAGIQWKWKKESHQAIRFALLYFNGNSDYGQFYKQNDDHWTLGLFFDP